MGNSKLFLGLAHYKRYTKVISYLIKYHEYDLDSYVKVEKLVLHSVPNGAENVVQ